MNEAPTMRWCSFCKLYGPCGKLDCFMCTATPSEIETSEDLSGPRQDCERMLRATAAPEDQRGEQQTVPIAGASGASPDSLHQPASAKLTFNQIAINHALRIDELERELADLKHDIARAVQTNSEVRDLLTVQEMIDGIRQQQAALTGLLNADRSEAGDAEDNARAVLEKWRLP